MGCVVRGCPCCTRSLRLAFLEAFLLYFCPLDCAARGQALVAQHAHGFDLWSLSAPAAEFQHLDFPGCCSALFINGFDFFWNRSPQYKQLADVLDGSRIQCVGQCLKHGLSGRTVVGEHPDFDESVCVEGMIGFARDGFGESIVTDKDHGSKVMRLGAVFLALYWIEFDLRHGTIISDHPAQPGTRSGMGCKFRQRMKVNTKSKKVNKAWLNDHVNDTYVKLAKKDGFRARAAYKLKEIDEVLGLIKPGQCVVDLGSAPGAWSQYVRRKLSPQGAAMGQLDGAIVAMDILPMEAIEGVVFIQGDFREETTLQAMHTALGPKASGHMVDVVVSDMAPNLSGIETVDAARISHLVELAVEFATLHLRPEGALVAKVFHGSGYSELVNLFRAHFRVVKPMKPKASRDKSSETFLVGMGLKTPQS